MSRFLCTPGDAGLGRRAVLAGASAMIAVGAAAQPAQAAAIADLVDAEGGVAPGAATLAGRTVRLVGFLAPSFEPGNPEWRLTEAQAMPCQLCGSGHDDGPAVVVQPIATPSVSPFAAVAVTGMVELSGDMLRVTGARVDAA